MVGWFTNLRSCILKKYKNIYLLSDNINGTIDSKTISSITKEWLNHNKYQTQVVTSNGQHYFNLVDSHIIVDLLPIWNTRHPHGNILNLTHKKPLVSYFIGTYDTSEFIMKRLAQDNTGNIDLLTLWGLEYKDDQLLYKTISETEMAQHPLVQQFISEGADDN